MANQDSLLASPRQVLTALLDRIAHIPFDKPNAHAHQDPHGVFVSAQTSTAANPLSRVADEHRHLLITLHVLFPSLVLPALDLLDRGLVARIVARPVDLSSRPEDVVSETEKAKTQAAAPSPLFLVQSTTQTGRFRRRRGGRMSSTTVGAAAPSSGPAIKTHQVRLDAWNCSCAGFAYSAFPSAAPTMQDMGGSAVINGQKAVPGAGTEAWTFGGASLDGLAGGPGGDNVPICKHLLACVLAERWREALGGYVKERNVTRQEMAGYVGDL